MIVARGPFAALRAGIPDEAVEDLDGGILLPGFVDTHVHYPQMRAIGGLGMPLLDWLEQCALPEESKLADAAYAARGRRRVPRRAAALGHDVGAGVRLALRAARWTRSSPAPSAAGSTSPPGWCSATGILRADLLLHARSAALAESRALIDALARPGRLRYAVTPRFSLSASDELLALSCGELLGRGHLVHLAHQREPGRGRDRRRAVPAARATTSTPITGTVWSRARSVFAHNVHATDAELELMGARRRVVGALPDQQLRARQRAVPAAAARRARRRRRARLRRRRRHRPVPRQGGAAGLLHAAAARPGRAGR